MSLQTTQRTANADGVELFYRTAGPPSAPVVLLLHGFPSSSHQYRKLMPLLASKYRVVAPDLPGFGFTKAPPGYKYTFANFTKTIAAFLDELKLTKYAIYVFDYGAPVGLRLALERGSAITAIITQNGNAYDEGFGAEFWAPLRMFWETDGGETEIRKALRAGAFTLESIKSQYTNGTPASHISNILPDSYYLDHALLNTPEAIERQLDILYDYRTNLDRYKKFHEYFHESQVPLLAVWGKNDSIFIKPGAEAFKKDLPRAEVDNVDGGHFAVESHAEEIAEKMLAFLGRNGI